MTKIDIISGFLGAGKTTLIKKLLEEKLNIDGLTFIQNNGDVQEVKHFHLHLKPYYNEEPRILDVQDVFDKINN